MKKGITILVAVILAAMVLSACTPGGGGTSQATTTTSQGTGSSTTTTTGQTTGTTASEVKDKVTLTFLCQVNVDTEGYNVNDNPYINYIREANNLDIQLISESQNYPEVVNTIMVSGDLPDYVQLNRNQLFQLADSGLLMPLNDLLNERDYPDLMQGTDPLYWDLATVNGSIYGVPFGRYDKTPYISFTWTAWLEAVGMQPSDIRTIDDFTELCRAYTEDDPDGNGRNDTYALYSNSNVNTNGNSFSTSERTMGLMLLDAFDAGKHKIVAGELQPRWITDQYKDYLKYMAMLYKNGYIVPDYITKAQSDAESEAFAGKAGIFGLFWSLSGRADNREKLTPLAPLQKADGSGQASYIYEAPVRHYIAITTSAKRPDRVLDLMNWAHTDEGAVYVHAGVETFDWELVNNEVTVKPDRVGKNWAWRFITLGMQKSVIDDQMAPILEQSWGELAISHLRLTEQYGAYDEIALASPIFPQLDDYDLKSLQDEYRNQAIMNLIDIDATWDAYVSSWRSSGGNEWIRLHTEWYNNVYNK